MNTEYKVENIIDYEGGVGTNRYSNFFPTNNIIIGTNLTFPLTAITLKHSITLESTRIQIQWNNISYQNYKY